MGWLEDMVWVGWWLGIVGFKGEEVLLGVKDWFVIGLDILLLG